MTAADTPGDGGGFTPGSPPTKQNLVSWWKQFSKRAAKPADKEGTSKEKPGIFGVPLRQSIEYANVAISLTDANGNSFIYGYVPIVVAKCGVFLKEKATDVEGIFRLSGSAKRIKDLQNIFNSPEKYGKGLDWTGYTVHDAANVLRRYLNQLPEPIIPLEFYDKFRAPLKLRAEDAIKVYKRLISQLPPLNRQLLLYILDLLAVFASKSEQNLMTSQNLSAIFQPGLISHPSHDMSPEDYRISQDVLVFLIENQDHFLMGMRSGADDEMPVAPASANPHRRSATLVSRSPSNASAGAEELRKHGGIRRNVSVSSRRSAPGSPKIGVARSNTLPSRRSPGSRPVSLKPTEPPTSSAPALSTESIIGSASSGGNRIENVSPATPSQVSFSKKVEQDVISTETKHVTSKAPIQKLEIPEAKIGGTDSAVTTPSTTPNKDRNFASLFLSPGSDTEKGKPNKLRKKRLPGSSNHSAESSTTSLQNPVMATPLPPPQTILESGPYSPELPQLPRANSSNSHINFAPQVPPSAANPTSQSQKNTSSSNSLSGQQGLSTISPSNSATSSLSSRSGPESQDTSDNGRKRRSRWRLSVGKIENPPLSPPLGPMPVPSSIPNGNARQRVTSPKRDGSREREKDRRELSSSDGGEDTKGAKGAIQWLQKKMNERGERRQQQTSQPDNQYGDNKHHQGKNEVADMLGQQASPPRAHPFSAAPPLQVPPPSLQLPTRRGDGAVGVGDSSLIG
ncbi:hypothetical protein BDZ91DRAFT_141027 [Kalaharituber pfeilii]|nr:hypothetical protein BDZ91DRAFT_141027 [Kalaharituber pfeilii]